LAKDKPITLWTNRVAHTTRHPHLQLRRVQEKQVTISPVLPTPINPASVSIIFREKLFKGFEPLLLKA
jgi:hypothetical protein